MSKKVPIGLLVSTLLLGVGCLPAFPSFMLEPTPTTAVLALNGVTQLEAPGDLAVDGLVWSPDSMRLAVSYARVSMGEFSSPSHFQIQIINILTGEKAVIEESNQGLRSVSAWLPGDRIAFYAMNDLQQGTWAMPVDGNGGKTLLIEGRAGAWSPDGKQVAFWKSGPGSHEIQIRNAENGEEEQAFKSSENDAFDGILRWSPDASQLLFTFGASADPQADALENANIYILELAAGNVVQLTREGFYAYASWSPDSRLIAYTLQAGSGRDRRESLNVMRSDGSCPTQLITSGDQDFRGVSWSPDGRRIAFAWNGGIYLLDTTKTGAIGSLGNASACP